MAATGDFDIRNGPVTTRVKGLSKVLRDMSKAGASTDDMKNVMHGIGQLVVNAAQPTIRTGKLKSTLRAGKGKTKAVVRMGGARAPYAGVINYGWPAHNIQAMPVPIEQTVRAERPEILQAVNDGIAEILSKNDLL